MITNDFTDSSVLLCLNLLNHSSFLGHLFLAPILKTCYNFAVTIFIQTAFLWIYSLRLNAQEYY